MGVLTVRMSEIDEQVIEKVKKKYQITTSTKALLHTLHIALKLEKDLEELRSEKRQLQNKLASYREHSLDILSGISGLQKLTDTKI
uniref:hypothetical protein n=1 Tax=Pedobacter sp. TaxID=1411316 RepID=UPI0015EF5A8C|nr:hypothetical protein [Pedobacter sp.]